jgi:hypothetical protein
MSLIVSASQRCSVVTASMMVMGVGLGACRQGVKGNAMPP